MKGREHWHQVRGYGRFYLISDRGRVKSLHGKGRILKQYLNHRGKPCVTLSCYGQYQSYTVAKLMKDAFGTVR